MVHVVCTQCGATNRISRDNDAAAGRCGKCGVPLFDGQPADLSTSMLEKQIARSDIPVVVDIWAPWCGPCRAMAPQYEEAARRGEPDMRFVKLNSDENQELVGRLGILASPVRCRAPTSWHGPAGPARDHLFQQQQRIVQ